MRERRSLFVDTRTNRDRATEQEQRVAKRIGGRTQPNSGGTLFAHQKGDLQTTEIVWELKGTIGKRVVVDRHMLHKACADAKRVGKDPGLQFTIEELPEHIPKDWVMVPLDVWVAVTNEDENKT
jgi:hypothetical protein